MAQFFHPNLQLIRHALAPCPRPRTGAFELFRNFRIILKVCPYFGRFLHPDGGPRKCAGSIRNSTQPFTHQSVRPMNEQSNRRGEVSQTESSANFGPKTVTSGPCSVRVRSSSDARATVPSVLTELPDLSRPETDLDEIGTISYGGFAMWEKPVWRGIALGGVVIVLLAAVWFFSGRGRNDSGGMTDSAGRWQVPVPQPDAPEAPRWDANAASPGNSAQAEAGQQAWGGWNHSNNAAAFPQPETPSKSPLGFDLPPGNRWGDSTATNEGQLPTGMTPQQSYAQPGAALPVPSYPPQGIPAGSQQTAWSGPGSQQPEFAQAPQPSWANAASSGTRDLQANGNATAPAQDGQPYTVQNPYYQPWAGAQTVAQSPAGNGEAAPSGAMPPASTWPVPSSQAAPPNMPATYPQSRYAQANTQTYGYSAQPSYASPGAEERVAFRGGNGDSAPATAGYVPAYSPNLNRPGAPSWNADAATNSAYPDSTSGAPAWGQPTNPSLPAAVPGSQPQVVDPAVIRADYSRTSAPTAGAYPSSPTATGPAYAPAASANPSPYYYPSTSGNAPVYPQTSTSTWNTYR